MPPRWLRCGRRPGESALLQAIWIFAGQRVSVGERIQRRRCVYGAGTQGWDLTDDQRAGAVSARVSCVGLLSCVLTLLSALYPERLYRLDGPIEQAELGILPKELVEVLGRERLAQPADVGRQEYLEVVCDIV